MSLNRTAVAAALLIILVPATTVAPSRAARVAAQSPYPPRDGFVANGTGWAVSVPRLNAEYAERIGEPYAIEGLAIMVEDCAPDPEVYLDGALTHYGLADDAGRMYDDAFAWLVCQEPRFVGFFWASGSPYAEMLDVDAVTDPMVEQLRSENYTGALLEGIDEVAAALASASADESAATAPEDGADDVPASLPEDVADAPESEPVGATRDDGGISVGWALAALGASGAGVYLLRRRAGPTAKSDPWQSLVDRVATAAKGTTNENTAFARMVLAYQSLGDEAVLELSRRHSEMADKVSGLQRQMTEAETVGASPNRSQPADRAAMREQIESELAAVEEYLADLETQADHTEMLLERAPVLLVEAGKARVEATEEVGPLAESLGLPSSPALFAFSGEVTRQGEAALSAGDRITAGRLAEEAATMVAEIVALLTRLDELEGEVEDTEHAFERLTAFAESSWTDVRGNGSEAEASLEAATEMLRRLVAAEPSELGRDPVAGFFASLAAVRDELDRAATLLGAVTSRLEEIERARDAAQKVIPELRDELASGKSWLASAKVQADVDEVPSGVLDEVAANLDAIAAATSGAAVDWPEILRQLTEADRRMDQALADAREQQARVDSLRRQAESAKVRAEGALERADRFLDAHRGDIDPSSLAPLERARSELGRGRSVMSNAEHLEDEARRASLEESVALLERAAAAADDAYAVMSSDFGRAEKERRESMPRRDWMGPIVPVPMNTRPWGFPMSGGLFGSSRRSRSTSWGSSRSSSHGSSRNSSSSGSSRSSGSTGRSSSSRRGGGKGW